MRLHAYKVDAIRNIIHEDACSVCLVGEKVRQCEGDGIERSIVGQTHEILRPNIRQTRATATIQHLRAELLTIA